MLTRQCSLYGRFLACLQYAQFLRDWCVVYRTLERAVTELPSELRRVADLESDLQFVVGREWEMLGQPSRSAQAYVLRLERMADEAPTLLSAHVYIRCRMEGSQGERWGRMVTKALSLPALDGVRFLVGAGVPSVRGDEEDGRVAAPALEEFRRAPTGVTQEVRLGFRLTRMIFDEAIRAGTAPDLEWASRDVVDRR